MTKVEIPAEAREIPFEAFARQPSATAANSTNRLYKPSGAMNYRVIVGQTGGALSGCIVNAQTGDEAAEKAAAKFPGWKVVNVAPAGDATATGDASLLTGGVDAIEGN